MSVQPACLVCGHVTIKPLEQIWQCAVVAEWLRRLTRNQFRSAGVGSNPTDRDETFSFLLSFFMTLNHELNFYLQSAINAMKAFDQAF